MSGTEQSQQTTQSQSSGAASGATSTSATGGESPWYPDAEKDFVGTKGWKGAADVITAYRNLEALIPAERAGRTILKPKDDKDVEGIKAFRAALGVPDKVEGYKLPDALKDDPNGRAFAEMALKAGIPATQFEAVLTWALEAASQTDAAIKADATRVQTEALAKLQTEWGKDFTERKEYAVRFLKESGWSDERIAAYKERFGEAQTYRDFYQWGTQTGEPKFAAGTESGGSATGKAAVQKQIDELRARRIAGQVSDLEFQAQMSILGPKLEAA